MASTGAWKCTYCKIMVKSSANYCPNCGQHWQQTGEWPAPQTGWTYQNQAPKSPRTKSPRQRPWHGKGQPAKGKTKGPKGPPEPSPHGVPSTWAPTLPTPWQPTAVQATTDDGTLQGLLQAVYGHFPGQTLPQPIADAVAKLEADTGRRLTKSLHAQTSQLGAAKKSLQEVRTARVKHESQWVDFLNGTVQALEKGAKKYQETMDAFATQEEEAKTKLTAARQAIRDLATEKADKPDATAMEEDDSDLELMTDLNVLPGPSESHEPKVAQAQKKLRVTLDTIFAKLPSAEVETPRRRSRDKDGADGALPQTGETQNPDKEAGPTANEWPTHAFWHSVMLEPDFLSEQEAIDTATHWHYCVDLLDDSDELAHLASLQGERAFRARWFGTDMDGTEHAEDTVRGTENTQPLPARMDNKRSEAAGLPVRPNRSSLVASSANGRKQCHVVSFLLPPETVYISYDCTGGFDTPGDSFPAVISFPPGPCLSTVPLDPMPTTAPATRRARQPSMLSHTLAAQVQILPTTITGPLPYMPLDQLRAVCAVPETGEAGMYTLYELRQNVISRASNPDWTLADYLADAVSAVHYVIRTGHFLQRPLVNLRMPQLAITPVWAPPGQTAIPVDLRNQGGQICTVLVSQHDTASKIAGLVSAQGCPYEGTLQDRILQGSLYMYDASGQIVERIRQPIEEHDWLYFDIEHLPDPQHAEHPETLDQTDASVLLQSPVAPLWFRPEGYRRDPLRAVTSDHAFAKAEPCVTPFGNPIQWSPVVHCPTPTIGDGLTDCIAGSPSRKPVNGPEDVRLPGTNTTLLGPTGPAASNEPTTAQLLAAENVHVYPAAFRDWKYFTQPVSTFRWGTNAHRGAHSYTVFDHVRHVTVEACFSGVDLESVVALAVARAPFAVYSLMILTAPLAGLPRPQIVIAEEPRRPGEFPVPWDIRPLGLQIRTIRHFPEQPTSDAIRELQTQLAPGTDLDGLWRTSHIHIADSLGPLTARLPIDLNDVQHFSVFRVLGEELQMHTMGAPIFVGGTGAQATTATTTGTYVQGNARAPPCIRLTVFRRDQSASIDVPHPYHTFDEALARLLYHFAAQAAFTAASTVTMARALPPALGYLQEVVLLISDSSSTVPYLWDARNVGGALSAQCTAPFTPTEFVISQEWRDQNWITAVNGVPVFYASRNTEAGDFLQPYQDGSQPPCTPQGIVLDLIPALGMFTWPFRLSHFRRMYLPRLRDRRWRLGLNFIETQAHLVIGPQHGDLRIFAPEGRPLDHAEIISYLNRLDSPPPWEDIVPTEAGDSRRPIFVTAVRNSGLRTILLPAPGFNGHWLSLLISSATRAITGVPATASTVFYPCDRLQHGDVLYPGRETFPPIPGSSDIEAEAATQAFPRDPADTTSEAATRDLPDPDQDEDQPMEDAVALLQTRKTVVHQAGLQSAQPCLHLSVEGGSTSILPDLQARGSQPCKDAARSDPGSPSAKCVLAPPFSIPTPFGRRALPRVKALGCNSLAQGPNVATRPAEPPLPPLPAQTARNDPQSVSAETLNNSLSSPHNQDIADATFVDHAITCIATTPSTFDVPACDTTRHWMALPCWDPTQPCDELFLFTDGSFFPEGTGSTWAITIVARQGVHAVRVGVCAGKTRGAEHACHGFCRPDSAFDGELEAILHALCVAAANRCTKVHIGSDCQAAIDVAKGLCATEEGDRLARATISVRAYLAMCGTQLFFHKIEAHSGCALNDLSDLTAKAVGRHGPPADLELTFDSLWTAIQEQVIDLLWLVPCHPCTAASLPPLQPSGVWTTANCAAANATPCRPFCMAARPRKTRPTEVCWNVLQYNALSLKAPGAMDLLEKGLRKARVDIAGLQETRLPKDGISTVGTYWVLSGSCTSTGQGGTQIWVRQSEAWDPKAFSILHCEPQILVDRDARVLLVSAHSVTATMPPEQIQDWWQHLGVVLHRTPTNCLPILFLDANATFQRHFEAASTTAATPVCHNARQLAQLTRERHLSLTPQTYSSGEPVVTWISPTGANKAIDYIAFPEEWQDHCRLLPSPRLGDLYEDFDHQPLLLRIEVTVDLAPVDSPRHLDPRLWQDARIDNIVTMAALTCPPVSWPAQGTTHVNHLQQHLFEQIAQASPCIPPRPRNPSLTEPTLALVRQHRHLRRCTRRASSTADKAYLQLCLHAWAYKTKTDARLLRADKFARVAAARGWAVQYHIGKQLRAALWSDRADFTRRMIAQARDAGPAAFSFQLRAILRTGRRYKPPALLPSLTDAPDRPYGRQETADSFGRFFALAERATEHPVEHVFPTDTQVRATEGPLDGRNIPSLAALAAGFAALKKGRAPGISGLRPEVFRTDPLLFAMQYFPIVCKLYLRDPAPGQWSGGIAVAVPKPNKSQTAHNGFRSIVLLECDNKACKRSHRHHLLSLLPTLGTADQFGGRPGVPLSHPAAYVKAHLLHLRRTGASGAVLFIDATAAYYTITRDFLSLTESQRHDTAFLHRRAAMLFTEADLQERFIRMARENRSAEALSHLPELQIFVQKQLELTWYVSRPDAEQAFVAGSGTVPGAPLADVLFSLIFGGILQRTREFLLSLGYQAHLTRADPTRPGYTPTWADDVSILLQTASADQVSAAISQTMTFFTEELFAAGMSANHGLGKTEALVALHGAGSRQVRRELLADQEPRVAFSTRRGTAHIRLVQTYPYLGSLIQADCQALPDVLHRKSLAREIYRPVKARILRNPALGFYEKQSVLRTRILSRFLHGASLWTLRTTKEAETVDEVIYSYYRGAFKPMTGISSQGFSNLEVASILELPLPTELLHVERTRAICQLVRAQHLEVLRELEQDRCWWSDACRALRAVGLHEDPEETLEAITVSASVTNTKVRAACRCYLTTAVQGRLVDRTALKPRDPCDSVAVVAARSESLPWVCDVCPCAFATHKALGAHKAHRHGIRALHALCAHGLRRASTLVDHVVPSLTWLSLVYAAPSHNFSNKRGAFSPLARHASKLRFCRCMVN
ncbi:CACNA1S [Symbiodinium sp. CCMP2592]|nr:CACNA1S [Symbiodinium sp. CCMP2592]